jgi:predicted alpha/beta-fold hydrolase
VSHETSAVGPMGGAVALDRSAEFATPRWLRNRHLQSVLPSMPLRRLGVERRCRQLRSASEALVLDCGDDVRLLAHYATQDRCGRTASTGLVILLHGWEGSSNSLYMLSLGQFLLDRGYDVLRLNLRDHGDSHHLNPGIFHSCRIGDVVGAVRRVQQLHPGRALSLAGFSLGGNFCLRVGARAVDAGIELSCIIAICPVLDPAHTLAELESGWILYRRYFVWKWQRSLAKKQAAWPQLYDLSEVRRMANLTRMTDHLARVYGGFPTLEAYLRGYAVVDGALAALSVPTRIIAAADDPIIPVADLSRLPSLPVLSVQRTDFGGHCGFFDGGRDGGWVEREVLAMLQSRTR